MHESEANELGKRLELYRPWCRVFVRQTLHGGIGRRIDESDIIQRTWVDVLTKIDQFRGSTEQEFFGWVRTCLSNNLKNAMRDQMAAKRDIRREQSFCEMDTATLAWFEPQADVESPSGHAIRGENALALAAALEALSDGQREAIELRHLRGLKLVEVAEEMGKSPDAVVGLIRRGMDTLTKTIPRTTLSGQSD